MSYQQPPGYPPHPHHGGYYAPQPYPMAPQQQAPLWRCPFCQFAGAPLRDTKISTQGWIVFGILLLLCFPFCFLGLSMKQQTTSCPACRTALGTG